MFNIICFSVVRYVVHKFYKVIRLINKNKSTTFVAIVLFIAHKKFTFILYSTITKYVNLAKLF